MANDILVCTPEAQRLHELYEQCGNKLKRGQKIWVKFDRMKTIESYKYRGLVTIDGQDIEIIHTDRNPVAENGWVPTPSPNFGETWEVEVITYWGWDNKEFALVRPTLKLN